MKCAHQNKQSPRFTWRMRSRANLLPRTKFVEPLFMNLFLRSDHTAAAVSSPRPHATLGQNRNDRCEPSFRASLRTAILSPLELFFP